MEKVEQSQPAQAGTAHLADCLALLDEALVDVQGWSDGQCRDGIVEVSRLVAQLQSRRLQLIRELEVRVGAVPGVNREHPAMEFLTATTGMDAVAAAGQVRAAHLLDPVAGALPEVGGLFAAGVISWEHVDQVCRAVSRVPKHIATRSVTDPDTGAELTGSSVIDRYLAGVLPETTPGAVKSLLNEVLELLAPDRHRSDPGGHQRRSLRLRENADGTGALAAALTAPDAVLFAAILAQLAAPDPDRTCLVQGPDGTAREEPVRDDRPRDVRQYDAFMALVRRAVAAESGATESGGAEPGDAEPRNAEPRNAAPRNAEPGATEPGDAEPRNAEPSGGAPGAAGRGGGAAFRRPDPAAAQGGASPLDVRLLITATWEQIAGLPGAGRAIVDRVGPVSAEVLATLACSAALSRVLTDERGVPLDVGRQHRLVTPGQRRALVVRDGGCVVPGCAAPAGECDAHHVQSWSAGGPTDLANLVLLCERHHQQVHAGVWEIVWRDGLPWIRPPAWVDPDQRLRRNLHHHAPANARALGQLVLGLEHAGGFDGEPRTRTSEREVPDDSNRDGGLAA